MRLKPILGSEDPTRTISRTVGIPTNTSWNTMYGVFSAEELVRKRRKYSIDVCKYTISCVSDCAGGVLPSRKLNILFLKQDDIPNDKYLVVDNIAIEHLPRNCEELLLNNDLELGHGAFWDEYGSPKGIFSNVQGHNSSVAIKYSARAKTYHGPEYEARYFMDYRCLTTDSNWEVTAQLKLTTTDASGIENGVSCNLDQTKTYKGACPSIRVYLYHMVANSDGQMEEKTLLNTRLYDYDVSTWNANGFNSFRAQFTVPPVAEVIDAKVVVRDFNANWDVIIDDVGIHKIGL